VQLQSFFIIFPLKRALPYSDNLSNLRIKNEGGSLSCVPMKKHYFCRKTILLYPLQAIWRLVILRGRSNKMKQHSKGITDQHLIKASSQVCNLLLCYRYKVLPTQKRYCTYLGIHVQFVYKVGITVAISEILKSCFFHSSFANCLPISLYHFSIYK